MGTTADLEATATLGIKLRRALALALIVATASVVGSQNISERAFFTAPVAADVGSESTAGQKRGSNTTGGNTTIFPTGDFESSIGGRYGGFDVAVLGSRGIPTNNSGRPIVVVELAVRNSTDRQLRLSKETLGLQDMSGAVVPIHRFEHTDESARLTVEPGTIRTATAVVRLPPRHEAEPDEYRLHIAEPYRRPLVLPITDTSLVSIAEGVSSTHSVGINMRPGTNLTVLELGSRYNHRAHRAPAGTHLVSMTATTTVGIDATAAQLSDPEWWVIAFDDQQLQAASVTVDGLTGSQLQVTVVFEVPDTAAEVDLITGPDSQHRHQAALTFTKIVSH